MTDGVSGPCEEREFLLTHLRHTWETMRDVHLCGEFVQTLRCFGDKESNNREVRDAVAFIVDSQDESTGGWQVTDADFKNSYHATVCAVGALMAPLIVGVQDKVKSLDVGRGSRRQRMKAEAEAEARRVAAATANAAGKAVKYAWEAPSEGEEEEEERALTRSSAKRRRRRET